MACSLSCPSPLARGCSITFSSVYMVSVLADLIRGERTLADLNHRVSTFFIFLILVAALCTSAAFAQSNPNVYLSDLKWRLIGPYRGGRTIAAAGLANDLNAFLFGGVDGGVWKTTNSGVTWEPIFDSQPIASIGALAIAPSDPQIIFVGTGETDIRSNLASGDGVYKSVDGGRTWKNVGLRDSRQISRIVIGPANPQIIYVAALGHAYGPNPERGVFKSVDGGMTWRHVLDLGPDIGASDLAIATANPNVLFAGMWRTRRPPWSTYAPIDGPGSGLYRSIDGGGTWTELKGSGLPTGEWGRVGVSTAPDGKRVYALIVVNGKGAEKEAAEKKTGLYRSDDGGSTWKLMNSDKRLTSRAWYFNWLTVDPSNPDVVYVPNVALYRTEDGGKTISIVRGAPGGDDYHDLWVDPKNPSRLIVATDQGASISLDRGKSWSSWYNQPIAQMYRVSTDNRFPYTVYGTQQDSGAIGVASRSDHGVLSAQDWVNVGGGESGTIVPDPNNPDLIYATNAYGGVSRWDRKTSLSQDISPWPMPTWNTEINERRYRAPWTPPLVFSPTDKKTLYFGTQYLMKTLDGGLHWQTISPDLTGAKPQAEGATQKATAENATALGYGVVYAIAPSPLNANQIWIGSDTGLIHLTSDGGKSWKSATPAGMADWSRVSTIEASHFGAGQAFAAVDRHRMDDQRPYIYRTNDFGKTWKLITGGIGDHAFVRVVREDPRKQGLLVAGTEFGIYVSFDNGDHWQSLQLNLPMSAIYDLTFHDDDLIVATHGRSFWVLDNITPLREAVSRPQVEEARLLAPAKAFRVDNDAFLGTPLPPEEPQAKNPPDGAILDYYLPQDAKQITLEILDRTGHVVRRYSGADKRPKRPTTLPIAERWFPEPQKIESTAGMHRFVWDLRWGASGEEVDSDLDEAAPPKGPRVAPGAYTVRLTSDGKPSTQKLEVAMDPRSAATSAELVEQQRLGREIYDATMVSRKAVSEAESVEKQLDDLKSKVAADQQSSAKINSFLTALDNLLKGDKSRLGLDRTNQALLAVLKVVQSGNRAVPAQAVELFQQSKQVLAQRTAEWQKLKTTDLSQLNQELEKAGAPAIKISAIEREIEYLMTR